jgi:small subunit ribosomal protein S9
VTEEQTPTTPLIDPTIIAPATPAESVVAVVPAPPQNQAKRKPSAAELGPKDYCWGTGRRKSSVARVRIRPGEGKILINKKPLKDFFNRLDHLADVTAPLKTVEREGNYDVWINVNGGGITGQAGAIKMGMARALIVAEPDLFSSMRASGYLTRDGRMKERKKYGQKGARKRFQFSKR